MGSALIEYNILILAQALTTGGDSQRVSVLFLYQKSAPFGNNNTEYLVYLAVLLCESSCGIRSKDIDDGQLVLAALPHF